MTTLLLTGAAGSGKTHAALQQVIDQIARDPFATVWVVLPTDLHSETFRTALLTELQSRSVSTAYFGVHFFDFYDLYQHLLQITGDPQRRINAAAQSRILRAAIQQSNSELTHFKAIAEQPGFVALVANLIRELKQARITPLQYSAAAYDAKDRDLALIYGHYQQLLQSRNLVDIEGEGWLALAHVAEQSKLMQPVALLVIDGFDQFNRVQAELIGLLSKQVARTAITLTYQDKRTETAHRRFAQTHNRLKKFVSWTEKQIDSTAADATRSAALNGLSANLFEPQPNKTSHADSRTVQSTITRTDSITFIETADPRREVETVLRTIKRQLLNGTAPDDIAIVARDLSRYAPYIIEGAANYGLPIRARFSTPLAENPAVAALIALLDLAAADFPRRAVIDILRSPYLTIPGLDAAAIDMLDRLSRERIVIGGRSQWAAALRESSAAVEDEDGELDASEETIDQEALSEALSTFFDSITPASRADVHSYIDWIDSLIGPDTELDPGLVIADGHPEDTDAVLETDQPGFQIVANSRAATDNALVARDLSALSAFKRQLADLLAAYDLLEEGTVIDWPVFRIELQNTLDLAIVRSAGGSGRSGRVLVGSVFEVRGLPHQIVYVLGLSEGQFPAHVPEDALYLDAERVRLNISLTNHGVQLLTRSEQADEASLFYELTGLARQSLVLSRPYSDGGNPWPASAFWMAAWVVVDNANGALQRIKSNTMVSIADAASPAEAMVAVMDGLQVEPSSDLILGAARWLAEQTNYAGVWARVIANQQIEKGRADKNKDGYRGYMQHPVVKESIAAELGAAHMWSAAQFNEYAQCPFGFFARRLLKLTPLEEPGAGADKTQTGSLLHAVLEKTYTAIGKERLTIAAENQDRALAILDVIAAAEFRTAPVRFGFRTDTLWTQRQTWLRDQLRALVKLDFSENSPLAAFLPGERRPYGQESAFDHFIITGDAGPLSVRGRIDRVDIVGDRALVVDYKSGTTPYSKTEMVEGRNVQMLLYTAAIDQQLNPPPQSISGAFWHIPDRKTSGDLNNVADGEKIQEALEGLHQRVIAARDGEFPDTPSKPDSSGKCAGYCEFSQLCRVRAHIGSAV
jgi:ATP-dependent helicase/DNAse subunit B